MCARLHKKDNRFIGIDWSRKDFPVVYIEQQNKLIPVRCYCFAFRLFQFIRDELNVCGVKMESYCDEEGVVINWSIFLEGNFVILFFPESGNVSLSLSRSKGSDRINKQILHWISEYGFLIDNCEDHCNGGICPYTTYDSFSRS